jgi:type III pantothenate kinase
MLLVDAGNSRIKSGVWERGTITPLSPIDTEAKAPPNDWQRIDRPSSVAISNVAGATVAAKLAAWADAAWSVEPIFAAVRREAAGVSTRYESIEQLGVDRWLAALAGYAIADGAAVIVDAGTATTIDLVEDDGAHLGGSIAPGLSLMVASLTRNTARLRLDSIERVDRVATNTNAAISTGCIDAVAGGIERMRQRAQALLGREPPWIITGGEAAMVMEICEIEFRHVPDLVLRGLVLAAREET